MTSAASMMRGSRRKAMSSRSHAAPSRSASSARRPSRRPPKPSRSQLADFRKQRSAAMTAAKPHNRRDHRRAGVLMGEGHRAEHLFQHVSAVRRRSPPARRRRLPCRSGRTRRARTARRRSGLPAARTRPEAGNARASAISKLRDWAFPQMRRGVRRRGRLSAIARPHHGCDGDRHRCRAATRAQTIGVVEPRHRGWCRRRDGRARHQLELPDAGRDQAGKGFSAKNGV